MPREGECTRELVEIGLDAGPDTIAWHLEQHHGIKVGRTTITRNLTNAGMVVAEPKKRPKSSYIRFAAEQPNECWQSDFTHWHLADGSEVEILDDHSWLTLASVPRRTITGPDVVHAFQDAFLR